MLIPNPIAPCSCCQLCHKPTDFLLPIIVQGTENERRLYVLWDGAEVLHLDNVAVKEEELFVREKNQLYVVIEYNNPHIILSLYFCNNDCVVKFLKHNSNLI